MNIPHYPVMNRQVIEIFSETRRQCFIDCTLGMGGHTLHLLTHFPGARVIAIDSDETSLEKARVNLADVQDRVEFHHFNFTRLFETLDLSGYDISGILVDPGISIDQLKDPARGFSHSIEAPLDMRKNTCQSLTAHHIINTYKEKELTDIFITYGEINKARELAKKIIETRLFHPIDTTRQLAIMIEKLYHWKPKPGKTHPAANVFQALRIVVNTELDGIDQFLEKIPRVLKKGTRIVFLTFHSIEDRIVKRSFLSLQKENKLKIIKPFPAFPGEIEIAENLASRSAKLRAGELV